MTSTEFENIAKLITADKDSQDIGFAMLYGKEIENPGLLKRIIHLVQKKLEVVNATLLKKVMQIWVLSKILDVGSEKLCDIMLHGGESSEFRVECNDPRILFCVRVINRILKERISDNNGRIYESEGKVYFQYYDSFRQNKMSEFDKTEYPSKDYFPGSPVSKYLNSCNFNPSLINYKEAGLLLQQLS